MTISDEVSIMRDGRMIGTWPTSSLTIDQVITRMVGRELTDRYPGRHTTPGEVLLEVDATDLADPRFVPGRVVPAAPRRGPRDRRARGAQRTELVEAIFGLRAVASGAIRVNGRQEVIRSPIDAKRAGHGAADRGPRD